MKFPIVELFIIAVAALPSACSHEGSDAKSPSDQPATGPDGMGAAGGNMSTGGSAEMATGGTMSTGGTTNNGGTGNGGTGTTSQNGAPPTTWGSAGMGTPAPGASKY